MKYPAAKRRHAGFSMIEVLVSLIILLVGLLSLAGLQSRSQQAEMESYQRSQALILLQDMVERINANRKVAACYAITSDAANGTPFLGYGSTVTPACSSGTLEQQARANADMTAWDNLLKGTAETSDADANVGAMIGARGCVTGVGANLYLVAVAWQGMNETAEPVVTCGKNQYNDEKQRRAVAITVQIATLN